jgi:2-C-methyl-D-erythritol 4-phosphate cytidylyltransferase
MTQNLWVVIPSAGKGTRFGASTPKQYHHIDGKTVLEHTIDLFIHRIDVIGIVLAVSRDEYVLHAIPHYEKVSVVEGGEDRAASVFNALIFLADKVSNDDLIVVHDAARPCTRHSCINKLFKVARENKEGAILALPATDTIKWVSDGVIEKTLVREQIFLAQTPQVFTYLLLKDALTQAMLNNIKVTDDASAIENIGVNPQVVIGNKENIKITTPDDLALAAFFLKRIQKGDK